MTMKDKPKAMIIDDSKVARKMYERKLGNHFVLKFLQMLGFDERCPDEWKVDLKRCIQDEAPDLVILDLALDAGDPSDGLRVLRFLREEGYNNICICSKYVPETYSEEQLKKLGARKALAKYPFPTAELFQGCLSSPNKEVNTDSASTMGSGGDRSFLK